MMKIVNGWYVTLLFVVQYLGLSIRNDYRVPTWPSNKEIYVGYLFVHILGFKVFKKPLF